jgi:hypothetical protein
MDTLLFNVYRTVGTLTKTYKQISHKVSKIEKSEKYIDKIYKNLRELSQPQETFAPKFTRN